MKLTFGNATDHGNSSGPFQHFAITILQVEIGQQISIWDEVVNEKTLTPTF